MSESSLSDQPRGALGDAVTAFGRAAWIGTISGLGVGMVMGVVNRVVMRIVAVMNGPTPIETDFGAKVLNFTAEGTLFLIIATTIFAIVPGLIYMGLRRILPGGVLLGGLAFGVLLAAVFGSAIVNSGTRDFQFLGEPMVSAAMFLGMFVAFGVLLAPVVARLDRRLSRDPTDAISLLYAAATLIILLAASALFAGTWSGLLLIPLGFALAVSVSERSGLRWVANRRLVRLGGYLSLTVPFVAGLTDIGQELSEIARV